MVAARDRYISIRVYLSFGYLVAYPVPARLLMLLRHGFWNVSTVIGFSGSIEHETTAKQNTGVGNL